MEFIEKDGFYQYIDENDNVYVLYPVTKITNIMGAGKVVLSSDGKTLYTLDGTPISLDAATDLTGYLKESDLAAWAKAAEKPKYTASEVGALPSTTVIPNVGSGVDYDTYRARSIALKAAAETPANGCLLGVYS